MKRCGIERVREGRIQEEVVVDAYGHEERAMSWYDYLERMLRFPFAACYAAIPSVLPFVQGETVEVRRLASEGECLNDMRVWIGGPGQEVSVSLSQLVAVDAGGDTAEALGDWHYWVARGYTF